MACFHQRGLFQPNFVGSLLVYNSFASQRYIKVVPFHFVNFHFCQLPTYFIHFALCQFPLILVNVDKVGIDKLDEWELTKWPWDHISLQHGHSERTLHNYAVGTITLIGTNTQRLKNI